MSVELVYQPTSAQVLLMQEAARAMARQCASEPALRYRILAALDFSEVIGADGALSEDEQAVARVALLYLQLSAEHSDRWKREAKEQRDRFYRFAGVAYPRRAVSDVVDGFRRGAASLSERAEALRGPSPFVAVGRVDVKVTT